MDQDGRQLILSWNLITNVNAHTEMRLSETLTVLGVGLLAVMPISNLWWEESLLVLMPAFVTICNQILSKSATYKIFSFIFIGLGRVLELQVQVFWQLCQDPNRWWEESLPYLAALWLTGQSSMTNSGNLLTLIDYSLKDVNMRQLQILFN